MAIKTRLGLSATPSRPYAAFVAKAESVAYALYNFIARLKTFNFSAENKTFNFNAKNENFDFTATPGT